jgi:hypothetical protein
MEGQYIMKTKKILLTLAIIAFMALTYNVYGQTGSEEQKNEYNQNQATANERLENAKAAQKQARADHKVTQKKSRDAKAASRETNKEYKSEKQAQKSRSDATKQAKKAADAREKSDNN